MSVTHPGPTGPPHQPIEPAPQQQPVFSDEHPKFPFLVYNHKTRQTAAALNEEHKEKLAKEGYVDEPFPPLDPDQLTQDEVALLQSLLAKAAKALAKLGHLTENAGTGKAETTGKK